MIPPNNIRACPICGSSAGDYIGKLPVNVNPHNLEKTDEYDLTNCSCGELIYCSPCPSECDIHTMYTENQTYEHPVYRDDEIVARALEYYRSSFLSILNYLGYLPSKPLRILEVGAGLAWVSRVAKSVNPQNSTVAQDLMHLSKDEVPWVDRFIVEDIGESRTISGFGPYHVISLTHVIEHLANPRAVMVRIAELLDRSGIIFITAPHRPEGWKRGSSSIEDWRKWSFNYVPGHLQYFSRGSMEKLVTASGLELVHWIDDHENGQAFEAWLRHPEGAV